MWSKQSGDATVGISAPPAHPHAQPVRGAWLVRADDGPALGWVLRLREDLAAPFSFEVYACGLGEDGLRVWLTRRDSLNSAVAWMIQHDRELVACAGRLRPDPGQPADPPPRGTAADAEMHAVAGADAERDAGAVTGADADGDAAAAASPAGDGGVGGRGAGASC